MVIHRPEEFAPQARPLRVDWIRRVLPWQAKWSCDDLVGPESTSSPKSATELIPPALQRLRSVAVVRPAALAAPKPSAGAAQTSPSTTTWSNDLFRRVPRRNDGRIRARCSARGLPPRPTCPTAQRRKIDRLPGHGARRARQPLSWRSARGWGETMPARCGAWRNNGPTRSPCRLSSSTWPGNRVAAAGPVGSGSTSSCATTATFTGATTPVLSVEMIEAGRLPILANVLFRHWRGW